MPVLGSSPAEGEMPAVPAQDTGLQPTVSIPGQGPWEGLKLLLIFRALKDYLKIKSKFSSWTPAMRLAPTGLDGSLVSWPRV